METGNADIVGATMEKALLCLRVMRKLTVHGFKTPHQTNTVMEFVQSLYERIKNLLQYRKLFVNSCESGLKIIWPICFSLCIQLSIYRSAGVVQRKPIGSVWKISGGSLQGSQGSSWFPSLFLCSVYPYDCRLCPSLLVPTGEPNSAIRFICSTVPKFGEGHCTMCWI